VLNKFKKKSSSEISIEETDEKLEPSLNFLNSNMATLYQHLDPKLAQEILETLWDELLERFADLFLPPLLGFQTDKAFKKVNAKQLEWLMGSIEVLNLYHCILSESD
jgi:predicted house-cleaning noncanonical NTP pyrophosphatase (MazG superfamily)